MFFFFFDPDNPEEVSTDEYKEKIADFREKKAEIDAEIDRIGGEEKPEDKEARAAYDENSKKLLELSDESCKLEADINKMEEIIQSRRSFKKSLFLKNIKALMAKTGVKIGQIEHEAQVSPGYLSRIGKEGSTSDPSLEFVITAADLLDVSVDYLLNGDAEAMTETDNYLAKFFTKVLNDTVSDKILWDREENDENRVISYEFPEDVKGLGILFNTKQEEDGVRVYYESSYGSRVHLSRDNDSFSVSIPDTEGKLYVTACIYPGTDEIFYEVYMVIKDNKNPLCSTYSARKEIKDIVKKIYEEIIKSSNRVHFSESVLGIMQSYLGK